MKTVRKDAVRGYRIDFAANTVYMNYTFAARAQSDFCSPEAERLREIKAAFPAINVIVQAGRKIRTTRKTKNLTYKKMAQFIEVQENSTELLQKFETVKQESKAQRSPYKYVRDWFEAQFPKYKDASIFVEEDKADNTAKLFSSDTDKEKRIAS